MPSWGGRGDSSVKQHLRIKQLEALTVELIGRLAVTEEALEVAQREAHFRLDTLEGAA